jgi:hypothetical protein
MVKCFSHGKKLLSQSQYREFYLQFRSERNEINEVFQQSFIDTKNLINDQIELVKAKELKSPKAIILVGGYGACNFLYEVLAKEIESTPDIQILQPTGDGP